MTPTSAGTAAGEIIAWNMSSPVSTSAETAIDQWMHSAGHKAQILSTQHNYAGVGVAVDGGRTYWTVGVHPGARPDGPRRDTEDGIELRGQPVDPSRLVGLRSASGDAHGRPAIL